MSAPAGNANASKWTKEKANRILDQIEELAGDDRIHTLTQALLRVKCYKQLWSYWKKKWEYDGDMMDRIYYIEQLFINKLEEGALFRKLHPSACFFILKHNYGYNTKGEQQLPSHLRVEFEEPVADAPQSAHTATVKAIQADTMPRQQASKMPQMDFSHLDLHVKKDPQLYASQKKSKALM
ncbi:MAG: hypothetical protein JST83_15085 [Bacteroidetes bacterium]|nr:hypothetical protein [Bacteroidota bacterium]